MTGDNAERAEPVAAHAAPLCSLVLEDADAMLPGRLNRLEPLLVVDLECLDLVALILSLSRVCDLVLLVPLLLALLDLDIGKSLELWEAELFVRIGLRLGLELRSRV